MLVPNVVQTPDQQTQYKQNEKLIPYEVNWLHGVALGLVSHFGDKAI
jgi:hypothetical protein